MVSEYEGPSPMPYTSWANNKMYQYFDDDDDEEEEDEEDEENEEEAVNGPALSPLDEELGAMKIGAEMDRGSLRN